MLLHRATLIMVLNFIPKSQTVSNYGRCFSAPSTISFYRTSRAAESFSEAWGKFFRGPLFTIFPEKFFPPIFSTEIFLPKKLLGPHKKMTRGPQSLGPRGNLPPPVPPLGGPDISVQFDVFTFTMVIGD